MKPTPLFLALVTALCGQEPSPKSESTTPLTSGTAGSLLIKSEEKLTTTGISIQTEPNKEVFTITGIPQVQFGTGSGLFQYQQFRRPKDAAEVVVFVWTSDNKKWKAKWEEVKP